MWMQVIILMLAHIGQDFSTKFQNPSSKIRDLNNVVLNSLKMLTFYLPSNTTDSDDVPISECFNMASDDAC